MWVFGTRFCVASGSAVSISVQHAKVWVCATRLYACVERESVNVRYVVLSVCCQRYYDCAARYKVNIWPAIVCGTRLFERAYMVTWDLARDGYINKRLILIFIRKDGITELNIISNTLIQKDGMHIDLSCLIQTNTQKQTMKSAVKHRSYCRSVLKYFVSCHYNAD